MHGIVARSGAFGTGDFGHHGQLFVGPGEYRAKGHVGVDLGEVAGAVVVGVSDGPAAEDLARGRSTGVGRRGRFAEFDILLGEGFAIGRAELHLVLVNTPAGGYVGVFLNVAGLAAPADEGVAAALGGELGHLGVIAVLDGLFVIDA